MAHPTAVANHPASSRSAARDHAWCWSAETARRPPHGQGPPALWPTCPSASDPSIARRGPAGSAHARANARGARRPSRPSARTRRLEPGGSFEGVHARWGLARPTAAFTGFATNWLDYDNDGWLDLFVANGAVNVTEQQRGQPLPFRMRNQLFRKTGARRMIETTDAAGPAFAEPGIGRGAAFETSTTTVTSTSSLRTTEGRCCCSSIRLPRWARHAHRRIPAPPAGCRSDWSRAPGTASASAPGRESNDQVCRHSGAGRNRRQLSLPAICACTSG